MRKLLLVLACCATVGFATGQKSFQGGSFVLNANLGFDGNVANEHYFYGPEANAQTLNGTANASDFSMGAEYGLFNWLGIGAIGRIDNYYTQNNQVTQSTTAQGAADLGVTGNIHVIRWQHLDLLAGYDYGFSHFTYFTNDRDGVTSTSDGHWSDIHATGRVYFGRLGFNICLYVPTFTYSTFKSSDMPLGEYTVSYWKSTGYGASVGIQYRIL
jgi:hypothetical protein